MAEDASAATDGGLRNSAVRLQSAGVGLPRRLEDGGVDLQPDGLASAVVWVGTPIGRERIDESQPESSGGELVTLPDRHRRTRITVGNGDPEARPVEAEDQFEGGPGVTDPVADELGDQEPDGVVEPRVAGKTPYLQGRAGHTPSFGGTGGQGGKGDASVDGWNLPK